MPLMPVVLNGRLRLVQLPTGADEKDRYEAEEENARRLEIGRIREYVAGEQYDRENLEAMDALSLDPLVDRLPEHLRLHAYSTQIGEAVRFVSGELAEAFEVVAEDPSVQDVVDRCLQMSDQLTGTGDAEDVSIVDVLEDALVAGDVAVQVKWDPVESSAYLEFWESEQVQFLWSDSRTLDKVVREELIWVNDPVSGDKQVVRRVEWEVLPRSDEETDEFVGFDCREAVFWDDEEEPRSVQWLGLPMIPWALLRVGRRSLRDMRGRSFVSDQAMAAADRYNANEQVAWLIARYNSHGNVVVTGDAAHLRLEQDERMAKDVADVLSFPGGTAVTALTLPTDPQMIEHQRKVLAESIYQTFGLTRVEPETLTSLGGVSGYALEILNRKTEGTFRRIRKMWIRDMKSLFSLVLDVTEASLGGVVEVDEEELPAVEMFPVRDMEIRMGSGYIVDQVMVREDFVAKLISHRSALRARGLSEEEIDEIMDELDGDRERTSPMIEGQLFGQVPPGGVAAGGTVAQDAGGES